MIINYHSFYNSKQKASMGWMYTFGFVRVRGGRGEEQQGGGGGRQAGTTSIDLGSG